MENKHGVLVRSLPATNKRPAKIQIKSCRFPKNVVYINPGTYKGDSIYYQAAFYLRNIYGHTIESFNEVINSDGTTYGYMLHSDTFEKLV